MLLKKLPPDQQRIAIEHWSNIRSKGKPGFILNIVFPTLFISTGVILTVVILISLYSDFNMLNFGGFLIILAIILFAIYISYAAGNRFWQEMEEAYRQSCLRPS